MSSKAKILGFCSLLFVALTYLYSDTLSESASSGLRQIFSNTNGKTTTYSSVLSHWDGRKYWPSWTYDFSLQPWVRAKSPVVTKYPVPTRRLPQVIGIGTKKCGTGALQYFLSLNPNFKYINKGKGKVEAHFFDSDKYIQGFDLYKSMMPLSTGDDVVFEKSPRYFFSSMVPGRVAEWNKNVKIILVVCDPVLRAYSDYNFIRTIAPEFRKKTMPNFTSFDEYTESAIGDLNEIKAGAYMNLGYGTYHSFVRNAWNERTFQVTALTNGMYAIHLRDWYTYFSRNQIHIIDGEGLISDPGPVIEDVQKFMGLKVTVTKDDFVFDNDKGFYCLKNASCLDARKGVTRGTKAHGPSASAVKKLAEFYKPYNEDLFSLIKRRFKWT